MVEQPSPAPSGAPVGGPTQAPLAPPTEAPDIQSILTSLTASGRGNARVVTRG